VNETGGVEVGTGRQGFYSKSRDHAASNLTDGREGLIHKDWLYGAHSAEADEDIEGWSDEFPAYAGTGTDSTGRTASKQADAPTPPTRTGGNTTSWSTTEPSTPATRPRTADDCPASGTPPPTADSTDAGYSSSTTDQDSKRPS